MSQRVSDDIGSQLSFIYANLNNLLCIPVDIKVSRDIFQSLVSLVIFGVSLPISLPSHRAWFD